MSTTVTYKGETLATVNNATKVLETEGKYLEDDITLVDVTGGGSATLGEKSINANGVYNASSDNLDGYSKVTVSVPASAVDTGTKSITANGNNQDVVGYAAVNVNVPNSYSAGDEGKVVSSGALVSQTAHADVTPTTSDQTIDTTLNNSLKVKGDADLVAGNIKKDVEIFGVTGSYEGSGGSAHSREAYYLKFYPAETYTKNNRLTLQLEASSNCYVLVRSTSYPTPDASQYKALVWGYPVAYFNSSYTFAKSSEAILRPNGSIGTDSGMCTYTKETGALALGGDYGHFLPEDEYEVIQIVFE